MTDNPFFIRGVALEYKALAFILLASFLMVADNRFGYLERMQFLAGYATVPIYWMADIPTRISLWGDGVLQSHTELLAENDRLRQELLVAQRERQLLESLISENSRLLQLRQATAGIGGEVLPAEIINASPDPYSQRLLINRGAVHGVFPGQALLDANGLMGQVAEVLPSSSWVLLITDPLHVTPVEVTRNGERALARGSRAGGGVLELEFATPDQDIQVGDLLVSSGMGQLFPKNYPVGEVVSVAKERGRPFAAIRARPNARFSNTRHVMLIFQSEEAEPETAPETAEATDTQSAVLPDD